jgi:protein-S-isoprenylcysteine O-methyltransferase Ste14
MADARPQRRGPLPPVIFLAAILAMYAIDRIAPAAQWVQGTWRLAGAVPLLSGLGLAVWASQLFHRVGTAIKPTDMPTVLVREGPFRVSRNPMYLGLVLMLVGLAIGLGSAMPWIVPPVFAAIIHYRFVRYEERNMEAEFGAEYLAYKERVRRWI